MKWTVQGVSWLRLTLPFFGGSLVQWQILLSVMGYQFPLGFSE